MNKVYYLLLIVLIVSCSENKQNKNEQFTLFLDDIINQWKKEEYQLELLFKNKEKTEKIKIKEVNWKDELDLFYNNCISKEDFSSYQKEIISKGLKEEITFFSAEKKKRIKEWKVIKNGKNVKSIKIRIEDNNRLQKQTQELEIDRDYGYLITQKTVQVFGKIKNQRIEGKIIKK